LKLVPDTTWLPVHTLPSYRQTTHHGSGSRSGIQVDARRRPRLEHWSRRVHITCLSTSSGLGSVAGREPSSLYYFSHWHTRFCDMFMHQLAMGDLGSVSHAAGEIGPIGSSLLLRWDKEGKPIVPDEPRLLHAPIRATLPHAAHPIVAPFFCYLRLGIHPALIPVPARPSKPGPCPCPL